MRQYLLAASGSENNIREQRIKSSLADIGNEPMAQKTYLSLESIPIITNQVDKGNGHVYEFGSKDFIIPAPDNQGYHTKLLASAIQAGQARTDAHVPDFFYSEGSANSYYDDNMISADAFPVKSSVFCETGPSSSTFISNSGKPRRRPPRSKRLSEDGVNSTMKITPFQQQYHQNNNIKRKAINEADKNIQVKSKYTKAVPNEGPPKA